MHKLESDLFNLGTEAERAGSPRLARKLMALASLSHYYVPDPELPENIRRAVEEGGNFTEGSDQ